MSTDRVEEMLALLEDRALLAVGAVKNDTDTTNWPPYAFLLHLCPAPNLQSMQMTHQKHQPNASISQTVTAYAWLNAHFTNAFFNYDPNNPQSNTKNASGRPLTSVVHLHQDVWRRSPEIVRSRLRSKTGMFQSRVYARKTVAKRISKSQVVPFLEKNHLWGATGAKYGYGLFLKPTKNGDAGQLIAVATFSSKRKVKRASREFHSFELLRFCTILDTTVVGGLTKLVAAFVQEMKKKQSEGIVMDIITSIDRDFGSNTWPNFEQMDLMDPIPMLVGSDGIRRHAVGAGLAPFELGQDTSSMTTSMLLRLGLPESVLQQLEQDETADGDSPWQIATEAGFRPVFDAGVERLMMVVGSDNTEQLSASELWEKSTPRYVKEHYSPNAGIESMLACIRSARNQ
ncbi:hypothetical protein ACHAXT_008727 [Thalassiosira profunda]